MILSGHGDYVNVLDLADIVAEEMGLRDVRCRTTGTERGWLGDAPFVHLDNTRLNSLGWRPRVSIEQGIRTTVRYLMAHPQILARGKIGGA